MSGLPRKGRLPSLFPVGLCLTCGACAPNPRLAQLTRENQVLREEKGAIQRQQEECQAQLALTRQQMTQVQELGPDRPADLFAPVAIEIASLSGGANYDQKPGDDGITIHLRPKDADGQVVKVPGRISIQLMDNTDLSNPKVINVCTFEKPDELRKLWMGILGTNHYTIRCPFPDKAELPSSRKLMVSALFVDFLTGKTLTAARELAFSPPGDAN